MLPVALDLERLSVLLVGPPEAVASRRRQLEQAGAGPLAEYVCEQIDPAACPSLEGFRVLMICAQELPGSAPLLDQARSLGLLLWMEDRREYCDFHLPACVRRGELTISVSTGGRSPALARRLRGHLERLFPEVWGPRVEEIGDLRDRLRSEGAAAGAINAATDHLLSERGWL